MRPSDEHQHRSKRPNLFSTSRGKGGADDNILARLERKPDAAAAPAARPRMLMLVAGLLIAGLIGTLAAITRDNASARRPGQDAAPAVLAKAAPSTDAPFASLPPPPQEDARAVILDEPAAGPAAGDTGRASADPAPSLADSTSAAPAARPAPAQRIATAQPARTQDKPQAATVKTPAAKAPRRNAPQAFEDPDVAILAAILSQAPRHSANQRADKPGEAECGNARGKPCPSAQF